jgi:hypothetical protein
MPAVDLCGLPYLWCRYGSSHIDITTVRSHHALPAFLLFQIGLLQVAGKVKPCQTLPHISLTIHQYWRLLTTFMYLGPHCLT